MTFFVNLIRVTVFFISMAVATQGAHAGTVADQTESQLFTGKLGDRPIVLELSIKTDGDVRGRYFYRRYRRDREVSGERHADGQLVLKEEVSTNYLIDDVELPTLTLRPTPEQGWRGEWRTSSGEKAEVMLYPLNVAMPMAQSPAFMQNLYRHSHYDYVRSQGMEPRLINKTTVNGYDVEEWQDPISGAQTVQLVSGYTPEQRDQLNDNLIAVLWEQAEIFHRCAMISNSMGYSATAFSLRLLSPAVISYTVERMSTCSDIGQGVFAMSGITLRSRDAKPLVLKDILWDAQSPSSSATSQGDSDSPGDEFTQWLLEQFNARYPTQMNDAFLVDGEACQYGDAESWELMEWYLTPEGVHFLPGPFVSAKPECYKPDWSVLPWEVVKQHPGRLKDIPLP
ncbi:MULTISPECIES: hypothetical protein [Dickeya]|uniref:Uncharacterized protein n=1 Tax=Dickeya aquatica TaxID=1401087 RepID=A0A375A8N2_9GAMM|nr:MULTISPECIES: hypothetical protein [Dickeya]SLM62393.1 hypothetical protein DAQ1742_01406 [Dickeya aquatica]